MRSLGFFALSVHALNHGFRGTSSISTLAMTSWDKGTSAESSTQPRLEKDTHWRLYLVTGRLVATSTVSRSQECLIHSPKAVVYPA